MSELPITGQIKRRDGEIALVLWMSISELEDLINCARERGHEEIGPMVHDIVMDDLHR